MKAICSCAKKLPPYICDFIHTGLIYVKECLQKCLLPLIKSHNNGPVFWPDLASSHYGKLAMEWYKQNDVNDELRVIKEYRPIIKQKMKKIKQFAETSKI